MNDLPKELIDKFRTYVVMWTGGTEVENENVRQCALIAKEYADQEKKKEAIAFLFDCTGNMFKDNAEQLYNLFKKENNL